MNHEQRFFVYRPPSAESVERLQELQAEYAAAIPSFAPVDQLHLTVLSAYTRQRVDRYKLQALMRNAPKISGQEYETKVSAARLDRRPTVMMRFAIKLMLDSEDGAQYFEEHEEYRNLLKQVKGSMLIRRFIQPHVTVGYLDVGDAVGGVMNPAMDFMGTSLGFVATESNEGKARVRDTSRPSRPKSIPVIKEKVRTIVPGGIPQGLYLLFAHRM